MTTKLPHSIQELWIFFREGLEVQVFLLSPVCKSADDTVFDVFSHFKYSYVQLCQFPLQTSTIKYLLEFKVLIIYLTSGTKVDEHFVENATGFTS